MADSGALALPEGPVHVLGSMRTFVAVVVGVLVLGFAASKLGAARPPAPPMPSSLHDVPVVVELFSSEGCSSCPPADAYLEELDRTQRIIGASVIAIEEHVDYWDDLGWRDPFAQPGFGPRQRQYATTLSDHRVYTPEIVIDGRTVGDGDDAHMARDIEASRREPRAQVVVRLDGPAVDVDVRDVAASTDDAAEVWLAVTESGLSTRVDRGENAGRVLHHGPVARVFRKLGLVTAGAFHVDAPLGLDPSWNRSALRVVAFVQRARTRAIVGAGEVDVHP